MLDVVVVHVCGSVGGQAYLVSDAQVDSGWEWDWIGVECAPHAEEQNQPRSRPCRWAVKFANWGLISYILFSSQPSDSLSPKAHAIIYGGAIISVPVLTTRLRANNLECPKSEALSIQIGDLDRTGQTTCNLGGPSRCQIGLARACKQVQTFSFHTCFSLSITHYRVPK